MRAALFVFLITMAGTPQAADFKPVEVVPSLDFQRYAGRWFEIARYPNRFQKNCASDILYQIGAW